MTVKLRRRKMRKERVRNNNQKVKIPKENTNYSVCEV